MSYVSVYQMKTLAHVLLAIPLACTPAPSSGEEGADGANGTPGPVGPQGEPGPVGPQGEAGAKGAKGDTGPAGPAGEEGDPGTSTGVKGDTGPQGDTGPSGPAGPKGDPGMSLAVVGPQGATGDTGPQGLQGEPGAMGMLGLPGAQGPRGATGPAGSQGAPGPQGDTGPEGDPGVAGPEGPKGDTGATGPSGVNGSPDGTDGTRIKRMFHTTADGLRAPTYGYYDTDLDIECYASSAQYMEDGLSRCLPAISVGFGYFADAQCLTNLAMIASQYPTVAGQYVQGLLTQNSTSFYASFSLDQPVVSPSGYVKSGVNCVGVTLLAGYSFWTVTSVPLSTFAVITSTHD
jgi:Collagen triple helix repeat (20 copies)